MKIEPVKSEEIEIKLDLGSYANYRKLADYLRQFDSEERQSNIFFDTETRSLESNGWALRLRIESERGLVTIKSRSTEKGAAFIRQEIETEIPLLMARKIIDNKAAIEDLDILPMQHIRSLIGKSCLKQLITFENQRQKKRISIDGYDYTMELDRTEFSDGTVDYELEVELSGLTRLEKVQKNLENIFATLAIPFVIQKESKLARALQYGRVSSPG